MTPAQFRGSSGRPKSVSGLDSHAVPLAEPAAPLLPAAATITASLSTAAYRIAAPSAPWSTLRSAARQVIAGNGDHPGAEIGRMHDRPAQRRHIDSRSRECGIATRRFGRRTLPDVTRNDTSRAPGAMPAKPSSPGCPAIRPATAVPRPSQSVRPSVDFDVVAAGLHTGQPWPRPDAAVQNRDQLTVTAGKPPRRSGIQHLLTC